MSRLTTIAILGVAAALAAIAGTADATDRVWLDTTGGGDGISFDEAINWSPTGVPGPLDRAQFTVLGGTVDLSDTATTTVQGVDLSGRTSVVLQSPLDMFLTGAASDPAVYVGPGSLLRPIGTFHAGDDVQLNAGTLSVSIATTEFLVDGTLVAGAGASIVVKSGAELRSLDPGALGIVLAAAASDAAMQVTGDGTLARCGDLLLGTDPSFSGVAHLDVENGGSVEVLPAGALTGQLEVGDGAELNIDDGTVSCTSLTVDPAGQVSFTRGSLTIDGGTMSLPNGFTVDGTDAGAPALLRLEGRADGTVPNAMTIGGAAGGYGRLELDFDSSLVTTGGGAGTDLRVGDGGAGSVLVEQGSLLHFGDDVLLGSVASSSGDVTVQGAFLADGGSRSRLLALGSSSAEIRVGRSGAGTLSVLDGALAQSGADTYVAAEDVVGSGTITIEGMSGLGEEAELQVGGDLLISTPSDGSPHGDAGVIVRDDGLVQVAGTTFVGGPGTLEIDGGRLFTTSMRIFPFSPSGALNLVDGLIVIDGGTLQREPLEGLLADGAGVDDEFTWRFQHGADASGMSFVHAGESEQGAVEVLSGSSLSADQGTVGWNPGSLGTLKVSGAGSSATFESLLDIGRDGIGLTYVLDGGVLTAPLLRLSTGLGAAELIIDQAEVLVEEAVLGETISGAALVALSRGAQLTVSTMLELQSGIGYLVIDDTSWAVVHSMVHDGTIEFRLRELDLALDNGDGHLALETGTTLDGPIEITLDEEFVPVADTEWLLATAPLFNGTPSITLPSYPAVEFVTIHDSDSLSVRVQPAQPGDLDFDGMVGFSDLLAVIAMWGPCPPDPAPCGADLDGDETVGFSDVLALIGNWG